MYWVEVPKELRRLPRGLPVLRNLIVKCMNIAGGTLDWIDIDDELAIGLWHLVYKIDFGEMTPAITIDDFMDVGSIIFAENPHFDDGGNILSDNFLVGYSAHIVIENGIISAVAVGVPRTIENAAAIPMTETLDKEKAIELCLRLNGYR